MSDPSRLTATQAVARIRSGALSPIALAEACLERIAEREPVIHAFAHLDAGAALRAAAAPVAGALHGVPVGVKDVLDVAGMPTGQGSPIWAGWHPRADAACVAWVRVAGAVVLGKTVTTEFATRQPGPTANPANPAHTPGGSSSGSAAGVADFMFPAAFGTQTAGSVIRPAAYCGVVGYKPSFGTINRFGMRVMADSLDTIGAMAAQRRRLRAAGRRRVGPGLGRSRHQAGPRPTHRHLPLPRLGPGAARDAGVAAAHRRCAGPRRGRGDRARAVAGGRCSGASPAGDDERRECPLDGMGTRPCAWRDQRGAARQAGTGAWREPTRNWRLRTRPPRRRGAAFLR